MMLTAKQSDGICVFGLNLAQKSNAAFAYNLNAGSAPDVDSDAPSFCLAANAGVPMKRRALYFYPPSLPAKSTSKKESPMAEIKAIETLYNGYHFRSRLEARYAVLFDHNHIRYEYEKQGYILEDGSTYLPDFWLPDHGLFIEIKGQPLTDDEGMKCAYLSMATKAEVLVFVGDLGSHQTHATYRCKVLTDTDREFIKNNPFEFSSEEIAKKMLARGYWAHEVLQQPAYVLLSKIYMDPCFIAEYIRVMRSARFEHGQKGFTG